MGTQKEERWSSRGIKSDFAELLLSLRTQRRNRMQPTEAESHSKGKEENGLKAVGRKPEVSVDSFHTSQDSIFSLNSWKRERKVWVTVTLTKRSNS